MSAWLKDPWGSSFFKNFTKLSLARMLSWKFYPNLSDRTRSRSSWNLTACNIPKGTATSQTFCVFWEQFILKTMFQGRHFHEAILIKKWNMLNGVLVCSCTLCALRACLARLRYVLVCFVCLTCSLALWTWRPWRASKRGVLGVLHKMACLKLLNYILGVFDQGAFVTCRFWMQRDVFKGRQKFAKPIITIFVFVLNLEFLIWI